jgi:hypothetical protein
MRKLTLDLVNSLEELELLNHHHRYTTELRAWYQKLA